MKTLGLMLAAGLWINSAAFADPFTFAAALSGANENPSNSSPGTGFVTIMLDPVAHTLSVNASFANLLAPDTAAHIHCCVAPPNNAGVATQTPFFTGFPIGVTSGTYSHVFDTTLTSTFNAPFVTAHGGTAAGAEAALLSGMIAGQAYFNVHSQLFAGGEIRGFLAPVPEPSSVVLLGITLLGVAGAIKRKIAA